MASSSSERDNEKSSPEEWHVVSPPKSNVPVRRTKRKKPRNVKVWIYFTDNTGEKKFLVGKIREGGEVKFNLVGGNEESIDTIPDDNFGSLRNALSREIHEETCGLLTESDLLSLDFLSLPSTKKYFYRAEISQEKADEIPASFLKKRKRATKKCCLEMSELRFFTLEEIYSFPPEMLCNSIKISKDSILKAEEK